MARIRTIKPEFFRHEGLQDLEAANQGAHPMLVFAALWGHCDKLGRFEWKPRTLKLDILPFLSFDMAATLDLLRAAGFIRKYRADDGREYGEINSFEKHQRISGKESQEPGKYPAPTEYEQGSFGEAHGKHTESQEGKGREGKGREEEGNNVAPDGALVSPSAEESVFDCWRQTLDHPRAALDAKRKKLIAARLKDGYSVEDLKAAILGCSLSPFHMGENDQRQRYDGLDLILRDASKVDQFIGFVQNPLARRQPQQSFADSREASRAAACRSFMPQTSGGPNNGTVIDVTPAASASLGSGDIPANAGQVRLPVD